MTSFIFCRYVSPRVSAASNCPLSTPLMPLLISSVVYAPLLIAMATIPVIRGLNLTGLPNIRVTRAGRARHGLFGWEEVNEITPAVEELKKMGYNVAGPVPADSVFHQAALGRYNSVLSLYHDQGHIATKTLDFDRTIAITNGMPILRTSVDHGTAFDIAGKGIAGAVSMKEAIRLAAKYAPFFTK